MEFQLDLYTKSSTAKRKGIVNAPKQEHIVCLKRLHDRVVKKIIKKAPFKGFTISSGFRCLELNRAIGSKDTSQHTKGQAVDFECIGTDNKELFNWCKENLKYDQLILEFYKEGVPQSGWVHCSYVSRSKNRNRAFRIPAIPEAIPPEPTLPKAKKSLIDNLINVVIKFLENLQDKLS